MISILPWHLLLVCIGAGSQAMYDQNAVKTEMGVILLSTGIAFGILALVITWRHARAELQKVREQRLLFMSCCLLSYSRIVRLAKTDALTTLYFASYLQCLLDSKGG